MSVGEDGRKAVSSAHAGIDILRAGVARSTSGSALTSSAKSVQVEMVSKQHQLLTMPMLAEVLSWQARVTDEPVAAPLAHVLEKCAERLAALFMRYIQEMVDLHSPAGLIACNDGAASLMALAIVYHWKRPAAYLIIHVSGHVV